MILLLVRNAWKQLARDRAAQVLSFVVPIVFFSIFAVIFGGSAAGGSRVTGTSRVKVVVVDESHTDKSRALVQALEADSGLRVLATVPRAGRGAGEPGEPFTRQLAEQWVKRGDVAVALVLPAGIEHAIMSFVGGEGVKAVLLSDPGDPVAMHPESRQCPNQLAPRLESTAGIVANRTCRSQKRERRAM